MVDMKSAKKLYRGPKLKSENIYKGIIYIYKYIRIYILVQKGKRHLIIKFRL